MANVPSKRWTVFDVLSSARELAKTIDQKKVLVEQGKYFYKLALSEIVALLNSASDPSYYTSSVLVVDDSDLTYPLRSQIGHTQNITSLVKNGDTYTIAISTGFPLVSGSLISVLKTDANDPPLSQFLVAYLTSGGLTVQATAIIGSVGTFDNTVENLYITVISPIVNQIDISTLDYDRIVSIEDAAYGQCIYVSPEEFASLSRANFQHKSYDDDIVWTQFGNILRFRYGSKVTTTATKIIYYQRQPSYPVNYDDTEFVDLADKWVPLLLKRIYTLMILQTENDVPKNLAQEMQLDYQQISSFASAEVSNLEAKPATKVQGRRP